MNLDVYTARIVMYRSLSCHVNNDLVVLSLFNKHTKHKPTKLKWRQTVTSRHILVSFRDSVLHSLHLISLNKKDGLKCFRDLFEIKHTDFFYSSIFSYPYIVEPL